MALEWFREKKKPSSLILEYGISGNLSQYMTMLFNPATPNLMEFNKVSIPETAALMEALGDELDAKMDKHSMNILQLMEAIAITCVARLHRPVQM